MGKFHPGQRVRIVAPKFHPELRGVVTVIISGSCTIEDPNTHHARPNCYYDDLYPGSFGHESCYEAIDDDPPPAATAGKKATKKPEKIINRM